MEPRITIVGCASFELQRAFWRTNTLMLLTQFILDSIGHVVAGTDTSAATLERTMTELARHPSVLERAQDEVRKIASNRGKVEESDLQHLHYMKAVIKETMPLHHHVPLLVPRESVEKCTLYDYEIPAKTRILINTYAIGRDPESRKNPLDYNPERFLEKDIDKILDSYHLVEGEEVVQVTPLD
ncbi:hypothetical protein RND71_021483 [Anisodus tanguticus]|uniref:Cytochrome P450 n=1 Tax=Anisodus tanguticus TaxID=243964 RepID=A0AAE1RXX0_9SOLA|nr:hypothetical protein RND71_021483 [Anisodus tanguticus]